MRNRPLNRLSTAVLAGSLMLVGTVPAMLATAPAATAAGGPSVIITSVGSDLTNGVMDSVLDTPNAATNGHYDVDTSQAPTVTVPADANCPSITYSDPHTVTNVTLTSGSTSASIATGKLSVSNRFLPSDVGNAVTDGTSADIPFGAKIATFVDASHVTITGAAGGSGTRALTVATASGSYNASADSAAGRRALRDSANGIFPTSAEGSKRGCIDIARSSTDASVPGATDNPTAQYYAYAVDVVTWASPSLNSPASLSLQELKDIYSCKITQWNEVSGGSPGQIQRVLAPSNSDTEASFLTRVLGTSEDAVLGATNQDPAPGSVCPAPIQVDENRGDYLTDVAQGGNPATFQQMIMPYSNGAWVYQSVNAANPTLDIRNGVRVGAITTVPGDSASISYGVRWSGSRFYLNNRGSAHAVIAKDAVVSAGSRTVVSASAAFKAADVGLGIAGDGIPAGATIAAVDGATSVQLSVPAGGSGGAVALTITGTIAGESNPNVSDPTETRIFPGVGYLYNVIDSASPSYSVARSLVGFDPFSSSKSKLCAGGNDTSILSAGFLDLPARTVGANTAVTCRVSPMPTTPTPPPTTAAPATTTAPSSVTTSVPSSPITAPPVVPPSSPGGPVPGPTGPSNASILRASGPMTISTAGAVIENVNVTGSITVTASNVTIRNFRAQAILQVAGNSGMVLEDGEIYGGPAFTGDGLEWAQYTMRRMNVHNTFDGLKGHGNVLIENSWIHDMNVFRGAQFGAGGYSHNDGLQVSAGSNITVRNSRFERTGLNSAIFIDADQGPINNVLIENNYLSGGGFTFYSIQSRSAPQFGVPTNVTVRNNTFGGDHLFDYATVGGNVVWSGNVNESGQTVTPRRDQ
ncbi:MAG: hypothetical protein JWL73_578 [Actinomycetia bacterium]|nr:hypothetical protein [Actinomycetes bacterium]